jgi:hypothetical protein
MLLLVVILSLIFLGSLLSCCGSAGGSSKSCSSRFLSAGLVVFFIFGCLLWIVTVVLFITGALTTKLACDSVR